MHQLAYLGSPGFMEHKTFSHPECGARLAAIEQALRPHPLMAECLMIQPRAAASSLLALVHHPDYIALVEQACRNKEHYLDPDTQISEQSYLVACQAAGGVVAAIDTVMNRAAASAFCAVRPPGHHALPGRAMGFCLFNNVAIGAAYLQKHYQLERILIVDWDAHHGNGTAECFYQSPSVLYFSVHQHPFFPGTGAQAEQGAGAGRGFTINCPLRAGSGEKELVTAFEEQLLPACQRFKPQFILISAGFDAHKNDPLAALNLTSRSFYTLTKMVTALARAHCDGKIVSVLEGGYNLEALGESVVEHLIGLTE